MDIDIFYLIANDMENVKDFDKPYKKSDVRQLLLPLTVSCGEETIVVYVCSIVLYQIDSNRFSYLFCNKGFTEEKPEFSLDPFFESIAVAKIFFSLFHGIHASHYFHILSWKDCIYLLNSLKQFPQDHPHVSANMKILATMMMNEIEHQVGKDPNCFPDVYKFVEERTTYLVENMVMKVMPVIGRLEWVHICYPYYGKQKLGVVETFLVEVMKNQQLFYGDREKLIKMLRGKKYVIKKEEIPRLISVMNRILDCEEGEVETFVKSISKREKLISKEELFALAQKF